MYAVLFQCVSVQVAAQCGLVLAPMALSHLEFGRWARLENLVGVAVRQFYEVTWACVTHLRFDLKPT